MSSTSTAYVEPLGLDSSGTAVLLSFTAAGVATVAVLTSGSMRQLLDEYGSMRQLLDEYGSIRQGIYE